MFHSCKNQHASLEGFAMPSNPSPPPAEGNPTPTTAIHTAEALLGGMVPLAESLGVHVQYRPGQNQIDLVYLFEAEALVRDYSRQGCRYLVAPPGTLSPADEGPASAASPDHHGRGLAIRALNEAAAAALKTLVGFAEGGGALAPRLRARLCAAARAELADLVSDFQALPRSVPGLAAGKCTKAARVGLGG